MRDASFIEHLLDLAVEEGQRLSLPALRVHQQQHPARTGQQHACKDSHRIPSSAEVIVAISCPAQQVQH